MKQKRKFNNYTKTGFGINKNGNIVFPYLWIGRHDIDKNGYGDDLPIVGDYCFFSPGSDIRINSIGIIQKELLLDNSEKGFRISTPTYRIYEAKTYLVSKLTKEQYEELIFLLQP